MTEDGNQPTEPSVEVTPKYDAITDDQLKDKINQALIKSKLTNEDLSKLTEDELKERINELMNIELEARNKHLEKIRAYHPSKLLIDKEIRTLSTLKEEELTEGDKSRIKLATLRLTRHRYTGTDYTPKEKTKVKLKRRMAKASRKANR